MRIRLTAALAGLGLIVTACGGPAAEPASSPTDDVQSSIDAQAGDHATGTDEASDTGEAQQHDAADQPSGVELDARCENPHDGYRIAHPAGWHANDGEVTAPCRVFDLEPPQVEPHTVLPLSSAVNLTVDDRDLGEVRDWVHDDPATDIHDVVETEIAGRDALRVDGTATGETYLDQGVEVHRTFVAFDGRTVTASANDLGNPDLQTRRAVIADMLATLEPVETAVSSDDVGGDTGDAGQDTTTGDDQQAAPLETIGEPGRQARSGGEGRGDLVDVRVARHEGFTRFVLEFEETVPAFEVAPTDGPITAFPSGDDLDLAGSHYLEIVTSGTRVDLTGDEAVKTYDGPLRLDGDGDPIAEAAMAGDHHGEMTWVLGLDHPADFAVASLKAPGRIVIDVVAERP